VTAALETEPPAILRLAGHPLRWRLLCELALSDRQVWELRDAVGARQSLVSYHLGRLRAAELVSMRRSSADARDAYYSLDLTRFRDSLAAVGGELHPGLRLTAASYAGARRRPRQVLFLCTGNSARSQMAEAFLEHLGGTDVRAFSAGSHPKRLHPNAVRAMREYGIEIADRRTKHMSRYARRRFDYVVSLCDRVREVCPEFLGGPALIHWSIADPSAEPGSGDETYPVFRRTAMELETRIRFLLALIQREPQRLEVSR
jgi:ArsR family transcriptional regulator, arsenate/arsenite/antimonite-responsive transcriptional repressor / arsenate reductase (thioredoxin)